MKDSIQDRLERYAMHAEEVSRNERKWLDVDQVGADLEMSPHESRMLADLLIDADWLTPAPATLDGKMKVRMTKTGFDEVAKLRWPGYQRWIDKHPRLWFAITWAMATVTGVVIGGYLNRLFFPPK